MRIEYILLTIVALFFLVASLPANAGCNASPDANVVAQLWAATCGDDVVGGGR